MSTLVITIDDSTDIVMDGSENGSSALGVTKFTEVPVTPRISYGPTSPYLHGETPLGMTYQLAYINFTVAPMGQVSEAAARALIETLRTSLARPAFNVTINVDGAGNEVWACHFGSVLPAGDRDSINLRDHNPEWNVSIPCYPVRVS